MMSEQCKAEVWRQGSWRGSQCQRKAVRDGYCAQHHPDAKQERQAAHEAKWRAEDEARSLLNAIRREREHKANRFDALLAACEWAVAHLDGPVRAHLVAAIAEAKEK